jgi:hypothetical protein
MPPAEDGDLSGTIVACVVVMTCLSAVAVGLRFHVRAKMLRSVKGEDWCMLASMVGFLSGEPVFGCG